MRRPAQQPYLLGKPWPSHPLYVLHWDWDRIEQRARRLHAERGPSRVCLCDRERLARTRGVCGDRAYLADGTIVCLSIPF